MAKLIIVGQIPPPFHGQSVMIKAMADGLTGRLEYELVPMRFSREVDENGDFGFAKLAHLVALVFRVVRLLRRYPGSTLYYPPAPPKWSTVLRDWIFLSLTRPLAGHTVFHFHAYGLGDFLLKHTRFRWLRRPFMNPDVAIILGELCRKDAEVVEAIKIKAIPYGVDVRVLQHADEKHDDRKRILFVGLHIESKGILDLLDTAQALKLAGTDFRIHTVGPWKNDQIRKTFESKRRKLGLDDLVISRGELSGDALWTEYLEADLFFFPTFFEFETFGLVVLEAMAYGLPVVASDWRGPGDVVEHGTTGFVCPVHNAQAYADAIEKILCDRELGEAMGNAGRKRYEERYSKTHFIHSVEAVFRELTEA